MSNKEVKSDLAIKKDTELPMSRLTSCVYREVFEGSVLDVEK